MNEVVTEPEPQSLGAVSRERVLRATQRLLAEQGLGISMDDIAVAADVGRRSLFRHFDSRDALVAEALERSLGWYFDRVVVPADRYPSLDDWLVALAQGIHRLHLDAGRAIWQLAAANDAELTPTLVAVNRVRRTNGRRFTQQIATTAWRLAGGDGPPPDVVTDAFVFTLSSYATRSTIVDRRTSLDRASRNAAAILGAVVRAHLPKSDI